MITTKKFWAILQARNIEYIRDRGAVGWNFLFPMIVVFGFAFAFSKGQQDVFKVAVYPTGAANTVAVSVSGKQQSGPGAVRGGLQATQYIQFIPTDDLDAAVGKVKRHTLDMVIAPQSAPGASRYWINESSPKGYLLERILWGTEGRQNGYARQTVEGKEIRYVDWLISGLIAMNMMFSALFGVGYTLVRYRKNGVLKRLRATPLHAIEFLTAQVVSRLILILLVSIIVYFGCHYFIHFQMLGSYFNLLLIMTLGAMCLISLSLLVASRISSEEFAGGLLNLISWPMMFLSGVWFSLEGAHPWVLKTAQIFPLTHVIDGARAIMTEGAGLAQIMSHLVVLALMTLVFLVLGSVTFKWE